MQVDQTPAVLETKVSSSYVGRSLKIRGETASPKEVYLQTAICGAKVSSSRLSRQSV